MASITGLWVPTFIICHIIAVSALLHTLTDIILPKQALSRVRVQAIMYLYAKEQQEGYYTSKKRFFMKRLGMIGGKKDARRPAVPARRARLSRAQVRGRTQSSGPLL